MEPQKFEEIVESRFNKNSMYNSFWAWKLSIEANTHTHILDSKHLNDTCNCLLNILPKWQTYRGVKCDYKNVLPVSLKNIVKAYDEIRHYNLLEFDKIPQEPLQLIWHELGRVKEVGGKTRTNSDYYIIAVCKPLMFLWGQTPAFDSVNLEKMRIPSLCPLPNIPNNTRWKFSDWYNALLELQSRLINDNKIVTYCDNKSLKVFKSIHVVPYGRYLDIYYYKDTELITNKSPRKKEKGAEGKMKIKKAPKSAWLPITKALNFANANGLSLQATLIESFRTSNNKMGINAIYWRDILRALYMFSFIKNGIWNNFEKAHFPANKYQAEAHAKACMKYVHIASDIFQTNLGLANRL